YCDNAPLGTFGGPVLAPDAPSPRATGTEPRASPQSWRDSPGGDDIPSPGGRTSLPRFGPNTPLPHTDWHPRLAARTPDRPAADRDPPMLRPGPTARAIRPPYGHFVRNQQSRPPTVGACHDAVRVAAGSAAAPPDAGSRGKSSGDHRGWSGRARQP